MPFIQLLKWYYSNEVHQKYQGSKKPEIVASYIGLNLLCDVTDGRYNFQNFYLVLSLSLKFIILHAHKMYNLILS